MRAGRGVGSVTSVFYLRLKNCVNNNNRKSSSGNTRLEGESRSKLPWQRAGGREGKDGNIRYDSSGRANPVPADAMPELQKEESAALSPWVISQTPPSAASAGLCPLALARGARPGQSLGGFPEWPLSPCPAGSAGAGWAQPQAGFAPCPPQSSAGPGSHWHRSSISRPSPFVPRSIQDRELLLSSET